ncbi:MAG: hypothetical protein ACP6IQ_02460 [Candidatus Njordarchaeia archaeon]
MQSKKPLTLKEARKSALPTVKQKLKEIDESLDVKLIKEEIYVPVIEKEDKIMAISEEYKEIPPYMKAVFNKQEYEIFVREVKEWREAHPDWNLKEDLDDIHAIALEKVIQYRLLLEKKRKKVVSIEKEYDASCKRVNQLRMNLAARRIDRQNAESSKHKNPKNVTNIAIIAGKLDDETMKGLQVRNTEELKEEDEAIPVVDLKELNF